MLSICIINQHQLSVAYVDFFFFFILLELEWKFCCEMTSLNIF